MAARRAAWDALAQRLDRQALARMTQEVGLAEAVDMAPQVLAGRVRGRLVVNVNA